MMFANLNKHYIELDSKRRIIAGWSDGPNPDRDTSNAICINQEGGYQFRLKPNGEENPPLFTLDGIPLYWWNAKEAVSRTEQEIAKDRAQLPQPGPSEQERLRADVDFLAALQGVEL